MNIICPIQYVQFLDVLNTCIQIHGHISKAEANSTVVSAWFSSTIFPAMFLITDSFSFSFNCWIASILLVIALREGLCIKLRLMLCTDSFSFISAMIFPLISSVRFSTISQFCFEVFHFFSKTHWNLVRRRPSWDLRFLNSFWRKYCSNQEASEHELSFLVTWRAFLSSTLIFAVARTSQNGRSKLANWVDVVRSYGIRVGQYVIMWMVFISIISRATFKRALLFPLNWKWRKIAFRVGRNSNILGNSLFLNLSFV